MSLRQNTEVVAFVGAARTFCGHLEAIPPDRQVWMKRLLESLAQLYAAAHRLPDLEWKEDGDRVPKTFRMDHEQWRALAETLRSALGEREGYWHHFDPTLQGPDKEPESLGLLWDDLADIYRDVRPGLHVWDSGEDQLLPAAVFEWKWPGFYHHWGLHAVDAIRALHWWVEKDGPEPSGLIY